MCKSYWIYSGENKAVVAAINKAFELGMCKMNIFVQIIALSWNMFLIDF